MITNHTCENNFSNCGDSGFQVAKKIVNIVIVQVARQVESTECKQVPRQNEVNTKTEQTQKQKNTRNTNTKTAKHCSRDVQLQHHSTHQTQNNTQTNTDTDTETETET